MSDDPASTSLGLSTPIVRSAITDQPITLNIRGWPVIGPVALLIDVSTTLNTTISINTFVQYNIQVDVTDTGAKGYLDQTLFDGFTAGSPRAATTDSGEFSRVTMMPSCISMGLTNNCLALPDYQEFEIGTQAIVMDFTNAPFNVRSTPAIQGRFLSGYQEFNLTGEQSGTFQFKQGFSFKYYGVNYTEAHVSTNGFVSFGQVDLTFPSPSVSNARTGVPRIMSFYTDLAPESGTYPGGRIYAQQFKDMSGLTKVKFGHDRIAEFANVTGPHGGEIVITDNDDIAVFVPGYQGLPSINTIVGITPGNSVDSFVPFPGEDLTMRYGTNFSGDAGGALFELFDFIPTTTNPMDIIDFANNTSHPVGPGIVFLKDNTATNTNPFNSRYIIQ